MMLPLVLEPAASSSSPAHPLGRQPTPEAGPSRARVGRGGRAVVARRLLLRVRVERLGVVRGWVPVERVERVRRGDRLSLDRGWWGLVRQRGDWVRGAGLLGGGERRGGDREALRSLLWAKGGVSEWFQGQPGWYKRRARAPARRR